MQRRRAGETEAERHRERDEHRGQQRLSRTFVRRFLLGIDDDRSRFGFRYDDRLVNG